MSDSPDTEVAFRNPDNMEDTGAQGDDDRFDDTVEDHGTYRRDRAGDVPDRDMYSSQSSTPSYDWFNCYSVRRSCRIV
jgi:hypothetical protein